MSTPVVILVSMAALLLGVLLHSVWFAKRNRQDALSFAVLGLLAGTVIGLSQSPVLAGAVAGLLTLLGSLIPLWFKRDAAVRPLEAWLLPLSLAGLLGLFAGMTLRANDLLTFRPIHYPTQFARQGFNEAQVRTIMDRLAGAVTPATQPGTSLLRDESVAMLSHTWGLNLPSEEILKEVAQNGSEFERKLIQDLHKAGIADEDVVKGIKTMLHKP